MADDYVLYDGACPACSRYVAATGLAHCSGIKLIDARGQPDLVAEHAAAGRMIDEGMMVSVDGVVHFGADATKKLAELGQPATPGRAVSALVRRTCTLGRGALSCALGGTALAAALPRPSPDSSGDERELIRVSVGERGWPGAKGYRRRD